MTEKDFAALLGRYRNSDKELTIESAIELMQSSLSGMMPDQREADSDICGATVVAWRDSEILLRDSEGKLYRIVPEDEARLEIDQDGYEAYYLLVDEGALDKVFSPYVVAEWRRLQAESIAELKSKGRESRRAEYDRLKAEFECD